jgi:hypothetical protein
MNGLVKKYGRNMVLNILECGKNNKFFEAVTEVKEVIDTEKLDIEKEEKRLVRESEKHILKKEINKLKKPYKNNKILCAFLSDITKLKYRHDHDKYVDHYVYMHVRDFKVHLSVRDHLDYSGTVTMELFHDNDDSNSLGLIENEYYDGSKFKLGKSDKATYRKMRNMLGLDEIELDAFIEFICDIMTRNYFVLEDSMLYALSKFK